MIIVPDLLDVEVERVEMAEEITLTLRTVSPTALCPSCGTASSRLQSRYTRTLRDLPSVGRPLRLVMHVRRFFCKKSTCAQKIFVERLPELCHPHAQRTKRLQKALCELGLKIGGQAGADVGSELGISGSRDTILPLVRQSEQPALPEPHVIGLDDWAWKRRLRYGTLICDLERGLPIDLLPDRTVETVSAWLNGPLEGNVNRLKLIKRSMYGRAEFDLLKLRVLYQSKKSRDRKNKKKNHQGQQVGRLQKPKIMKSGRNSQHTTTG